MATAIETFGLPTEALSKTVTATPGTTKRGNHVDKRDEKLGMTMENWTWG